MLIAPRPVFEQIYTALKSTDSVSDTVVCEQVKLSMTVDKMPLYKLLRWLSDQAKISVVCEAGLDEKEVTVEFREQPVGVVLGMVARRLRVDIARQGGVYYLGQLKREDRGVLVRKVSRLSAEELKSAVEVVGSDIGRRVTFDDGLLVVGDRVEILERINSLLDDIEAAPNNSWVLQFYLVSITGRASAELGFDSVPSLEISAQLVRASDSLLDVAKIGNVEIKLDAALSAVLRASREVSDVSLVAQPLFLLLDGGSAEFSAVEEIPVAKKTVSDAGTVTEIGYEYIEAGLKVSVEIREVGRSQSKAVVSIELSDVSGYVGDAPIKRSQKFDTTSVLVSGGVYLLGRLDRQDNSNGKSGPLLMARADSASKSTVQVWCKAYKVGGAVW